MDTYVNKIMTNHVFNSESSEDLYYLYSEKDEDMYGGAKRSKMSMSRAEADVDSNEDRPRGGFPPIYIVDKKEKESEKSKDRQLSSRKTSVSIRDILKSKK